MSNATNKQLLTTVDGKSMKINAVNCNEFELQLLRY